MSTEAKRSALAGAVVFGVLYALVRPIVAGSVQDDGIYVVLARALATGEGYRYLHLPGMPHGTHYPPGYPLALAALWRLWPSFPENVALFQLLNVVAGAAAAAAAYLLARAARLPVVAATLAALLGLLMPYPVSLLVPLMSEPLWLAITIPFLIVAERVASEPAPRRHDLLLAGVLVFLTLLVRTQAVAFAGAFGLVLLWRHRWAAAAVTASSAAAMLVPWMWWMHRYAGELPPFLQGKYGPYGRWLTDGYRDVGPRLLWGSLAGNAADVATLLGQAVSPPSFGTAGVVVAVALLAVLAVLGVRALIPVLPVTLLSLALYFLMILAWPFRPHRFLWTVWPLLTLVLMAGAVHLAAWAHQARWRRVAALSLLTLVAGGAARHVTTAYRQEGYRHLHDFGLYRLGPVVEWVGANTAPGDLVVSDDETAIFLYTGRQSVPGARLLAEGRLHGPEFLAPAATLPDVIAAYHPQWVVASWRTTVTASRALEHARPPVLAEVARPGWAIAFRRLR